DRNRSHWSTSKTPSYTKSVSWQHYPGDCVITVLTFSCQFSSVTDFTKI
ncbi:transposase, partial [Escherichia coli]